MAVETKVKHTPGPWKSEETSLSIVRLIITPEEVDAYHITSETGVSIGYLHRESGNEELEANARLVVNAPNLLVMLRCVRDYFDKHPEEWVLARGVAIAVAKAEGRQ